MDSKIKNILVAYFSHSGNTREIAGQIYECAGGDIFEIVTVDPYPVDYNAVVNVAKQEQKNDYRQGLAIRGSSVNKAQNSVSEWLRKLGGSLC